MYTSAHYVSSNLENRPQRNYFRKNIRASYNGDYHFRKRNKINNESYYEYCGIIKEY